MSLTGTAATAIAGTTGGEIPTINCMRIFWGTRNEKQKMQQSAGGETLAT